MRACATLLPNSNITRPLPPAPPPQAQACTDVSFCRRLRGAPPSNIYTVEPGSVNVTAGVLTARLVSASAAPGAPLKLSLTALTDSFRLLVDEENPKAGRYQVKDVLLPGFDERMRQVGRATGSCRPRWAWASICHSAGGMHIMGRQHTGRGPGGKKMLGCRRRAPPPQDWVVVSKSRQRIALRLGGSSALSTFPYSTLVELQYDPVQLAVTQAGQEVLVWNADRRFTFEPVRMQRQVLRWW